MALAQLLAGQGWAEIGVVGLDQSTGAVHPPALHQAPDLTRRQIEPFGCAPLRQQSLGGGLDDLEAVASRRLMVINPRSFMARSSTASGATSIGLCQRTF